MIDSRFQFWQQEYSAGKDVPSSRTYRPSSAISSYFAANNKLAGLALDLGAGNLRNSIYLASLGLEVVAIEMIKEATDLGIIEAHNQGVDTRIKVINEGLGKEIDLQDESIDIVVDMMVLHALSKAEREVVANEIQRVLKLGGTYLLFTIGAEGSQYEKLMEESKGSEPGSYIFEHKGFKIQEKAFSQEEIAVLFSKLKVERFERTIQETSAFGGIYERVYYFFVLRKI